MKRSILGTGLVPAALALSLALAACGGGEEESDDTTTDAASAAADTADAGGEEPAGDALSGSILGAGASSQEAAQQAWRASYIELQPDVQVDYQSVGSGAGREQFLQGAVDFAASDAYLDDEELALAVEPCGDAGIVEFPVYISPVALPYNLPGVDSLNLSPDNIAKIFAGEITTWNDPALAADNPDVELPDTAINPVHRSDESGTTENFMEYLSAVAPDTWTYEVDKVWPADLGGEAAAQTSGVIAAVTAGEGSIGYADASQAAALSTAAVGVGDEFVTYSPEAAAKVVEASTAVEGRGEGDIALDVARDTTESGAYPIILVSYAIACKEYDDANKAAAVADYLGYIAGADGQAAAAEAAGAAPLSAGLQEQAAAAIAMIGAAG